MQAASCVAPENLDSIDVTVPVACELVPSMMDQKMPGVRIPPQPLGAQTREILLEYGFPASEIKKYEKMNIIKCS